MPEKIRPIEQMLELSEEESLSPEHLDSQVQKAQDQLLQLKRQQDQIEKQKRELEELSRKQEELERGRAEMSDKLTRSLVVLEREAYDAQKTTRATAGDAGKFRPAFGVDRGDRSEKLEPGRFAQGTEPGAEHGGRRAGRIRSATQPF